ncbi:hypothetical protein VTI74DRAFT_6551 [Chaetomium olivicolor]
MLIAIALAAIAAAALLRLAGPSGQVVKRRPVMATSSEVEYPGEDLCEDQLQPDRPRVSYGSTAGALVFGWPSKGGVYVHRASAVEIEFLGYERFKPVHRPSQTDPDGAADEESHCNKSKAPYPTLRQLGAVWWESEDAWFTDQRRVRSPPFTKNFLSTGWPVGGGVWVLSTTARIAAEKHAGMLLNAYNMEERCKVIKQLGGTFYADLKDCPYLDLA